ncbi:alpha/beta hydrolase family protein DUF900 [Nitrosomonas ureae]|uniref:hypothetical protein n=1 Tax=Nitrosomonas ureae TaxID=44577 RepID=UPI000D886311|nr:hypothetical protein [Nitrosomonas ureae]PXX16509.1 alpha/beta hydrolase family protein DUF900 [Nitrosomonas ureae]
MMKFNALIFVLLTFLSGCSSIPGNSEIVSHQIYIDKRGDLVNPINKNPILENAAVDAYVNKIAEDFKKSGKNKVTIFIHGGLNTFQNATEKASQLLEQFDDKDSYPIFIGWQAGPFTNYLDHLFFIRNGERRPVLGFITSLFVLIEDVAKSVAKTPRAIIETFLSQASVPKSINSKEEQAYYASKLDLEMAQPERKINLHTKGDTTGLGFIDVASIINPIKLVTAPFVDGLGTGTWDSLVRRTDLLITRDTSFNGIDNPETALEKILERLSELPNKPKIDLIGHSMGTIVAINIMARKPKLNYSNIVFMGAAARIKDLEYVVVPIMQNNQEVQFYNLSLDPYRELSESHYLDSVPRGSLLIWIDSFFSNVSSFGDKTAGSWFNIVRSANTVFPESVKSRVHLTRFGINSGPQEHGDFDEYKFWRHDFWIGKEATLLK